MRQNLCDERNLHPDCEWVCISDNLGKTAVLPVVLLIIPRNILHVHYYHSFFEVELRTASSLSNEDKQIYHILALKLPVC